MYWRVVFLVWLIGMAGACEPAVPLMRAMSGSLLSAGSVIGVLVTVAFKCGIFGLMVPRGRRWEGAGRMLVANVMSGVMGFALVAILAAPFLPLLALVPLVSWLPARRLVEMGVVRVRPFTVVLLITILFVINAVLWGASRHIIEADQTSRMYWLIKIAWLIPSLGIALLTGTMWEDWIVSAQSGSMFVDDRTQLQAVFRANAWALLMAMAFGAALALPQRLRDPNFLLHGW